MASVKAHNISLSNNKVVVGGDFVFDLRATLECGQTFRFVRHIAKEKFDVKVPLVDKSSLIEFVDEERMSAPFDVFEVMSEDKHCYAFCVDDVVIIESETPKYFVHYFDLDRDYSLILKDIEYRLESISASGLDFDTQSVRRAINVGKGIRILNQNPFEMLISFIISANNNIPRIKLIIDKLCCQLGRECNGYYAFPTISEMCSTDRDFFRKIGAGFRDKYLYETSQRVAEGFDLIAVESMSTSQATKALCTLSGVGKKVADCILLFGYHKTDLCPVDVWIHRAYRLITGKEEADNDKIRCFFVDLFGENAGYFQQFIFNFYRNWKIDE